MQMCRMWNNQNEIVKGTVGNGRTRTTTTRKGKGLILGKHSPFNKIPILGAIL